MKKTIAALVAVAGFATASQAVYGLKYEVSKDGGTTWSSNVSANAGDTITFRVLAYHDGTDQVSSTNPPPGGSGTTRSVARHTGSHKITNWDASDTLGAWNFSLPQGNNAFKATSDSSGSKILGTAGNAASFTSILLTAGPRPYIAEQELARGSFTIGAGNQNRTMLVQNNTFGAGASAGLNFYFSDTVANSAAPSGAPVNIDASVRVIPTPGALALVGLGGLVAARRRRA